MINIAKDPAFLFYTADFYIGTVDMTNEQVGQYIRLICLQHQKGPLSEQAMVTVMQGKRDELIMSKFKLNDDGLYFNERLEAEIEKRNKYASSRRRNRLGITHDNAPQIESSDSHMNNHMNNHMCNHMSNHMCGHMNNHMSNHMVNENENTNDNDNENDVKKQESTTRTRARDTKRKYGEYGWVLLSEQDYQKLLDEFGEAELKRCIQYIDESAQSSGNKNKWKDWNLVIRRCQRERWGAKPSGETKGATNAINRGNTVSGFRPSTGFRRAEDDYSGE